LIRNVSTHYPDQVTGSREGAAGGAERFRRGNGAAWLDLLATVRDRYRGEHIDALTDPAALRAWLHAYDLEPTGTISPADLAQFRATREALHHVAAAGLRGDPPAAADVRFIDAALAAPDPVRVRNVRGRLGLTRPASAAQSLGRLTRAAVADLTGPNRGDLHPCGDDTCSGIFLDHTARRRWCGDQSCGNRARVRAHRARSRPTGG
jgi:predicted RNA-binding Zn ribbon-like protein